MTEEAIQAVRCPICGQHNDCGNMAGNAHGACWCSRETFPEALFDLVPAGQLRKSCICKNCLDRFVSS